MELREGNVFSLSVHWGGGPHVTITHGALDLTVQASLAQALSRHGTWGPQPEPPPDIRTLSWSDLQPRPLQTWDIGPPTLVPLLVPSGGYYHQLIHLTSLSLSQLILGGSWSNSVDCIQDFV